VKPTGSIRLLEYVSAPSALRRCLSRCWQPLVKWAFGAKLDQDFELELFEGGFIITHSHFVTSTIKLTEARPAEPLTR
jgi:hypothetical protein